MERSRMSGSDFSATYRGTWLLAQWEGQHSMVPVLIRDVEQDGNDLRVYVHRADRAADTHFLVYGTHTVINWDHPKMGMVNTGKLVAYHQRLAIRQWKRGLRASLLNTEVLGNSMMQALRKTSQYSFDHGEHIMGIFNPQYDTFEEAISKVVGGECYARAFSPDMCIEARPEYKLPLIIHRTSIVGVVVDGEPEFFQGSEYLQDKFQCMRNMECQL